MEPLESQRGKGPAVTLLISVRVGTLANLLPAALLCILPHMHYFQGISVLRMQRDQGKTGGTATLSALNKAVGLTLLLGRSEKTLGCPEALGLQTFPSTVATNCFSRAASQG